MKTKTLFFICLLLSIATSELRAQKTYSGKDTYAVTTIEPGTGVVYLYCGDEFKDYLYGPVDIHVIRFYKDGIYVGYRAQVNNGTLPGLDNEEIYTIKCEDRPISPSESEENRIFHYNIVSSHGDRYVGFNTYEWHGTTGPSPFIGRCPGSNK